MVARLKLKEIDGRAPPGVNAALCAGKRPVRVGGLPSQTLVTSEEVATCLNCGKLAKHPNTKPSAERGWWPGQFPGYGNSVGCR